MYGLRITFRECISDGWAKAKNLDKGIGVVSHAGMRWNRVSSAVVSYGRLTGRNPRTSKLSLKIFAASVLCLAAAGCTKPIAQHTAALAAVVAPVVDQATVAYNSANTIHDTAENYEAVAAFDKATPVYNPRTTAPLLTQDQIDLRLAVLKGLQTYSQTLVAVSGTQSAELDEASKSLGNGLTKAGDRFLPATSGTPETVTVTEDGVSETETTTPQVPAISATEQNMITTGINALGQYLVGRKIKEELPGVTAKMDPQVKQLCEILSKEIDILSSQETIDYRIVITQQTLFLRKNTNLDPETRREQIMKLPELARQQKEAAAQLKQLKSALGALEMTHHALAEELAKANPESISQKFADLGAAGSNLGKFYSSLSASK